MPRRRVAVWGALAASAAVLGACGGAPEDRLEDGTHFGLIAEVDPVARRLELDPATVVEEDGAFRVENPSAATVTLAIAEDATIRLLVPCCELHETPLTEWAVGFVPDGRSFYGTSHSHYEVTVADGTVVAVDEIRIR